MERSCLMEREEHDAFGMVRAPQSRCNV